MIFRLLAINMCCFYNLPVLFLIYKSPNQALVDPDKCFNLGQEIYIGLFSSQRNEKIFPIFFVPVLSWLSQYYFMLRPKLSSAITCWLKGLKCLWGCYSDESEASSSNAKFSAMAARKNPPDADSLSWGRALASRYFYRVTRLFQCIVGLRAAIPIAWS